MTIKKTPISTSLVEAKRLDVSLKVLPTVDAGVVSLAVAETRQKQAEEDQKKMDADMEAEFVQSLQDGSYFVGEEVPAPSTAAIVAEEGAGEQNGEGNPEVLVISGEPAAAPSEEPAPEAPSVTEAPAETAKEKFEKVMDWLTADQMRLTIILTVFCMVCWTVVKLVKK